MPVDTTNLLSGASTGATIGSAIPGIGTAVGAGVGALISLLGGLIGSKKSPQEKAIEELFASLKDYLPELGKEAYSKSEIQNIVNNMKAMLMASGDIAASRLGSVIGESDIAKGGGWADYYMSAIAPVIAQGITQAAEAEKFGVGAYADIQDAAKRRSLAGYQTLLGAGQYLPSMTSGQRGLVSGLQTLNLLSTAFGNIASAYSNLNKKPIG